MDISFNSIPLLLRPGFRFEFNSQKSNSGPVAQPDRILVIGSKLAGGTVDPLVPTLIASPVLAQSAFKRGSLLQSMLDVVLDVNKSSQVTAIALADDDDADPATGTITYTGPATGNGTVALYIDGIRVRAKVTASDTATIVGNAVRDAINANDLLSVTASAAVGVVTLTARNAGETGNYIDVRHNANFGEAYPKGIAAAVVAMSGGTANPDIADALDAAGPTTQYRTIIMAYQDAANLNTLADELLTRWDGLHTNDGIGFNSAAGTFSDITTLGAARNDGFMTIMGKGASMTPPWIFAANYGAIRATQSAPTQIGLPLQYLPLKRCAAPAEADRFSDDEREQLLAKGIATYFVDDGGNCIIERAVTTWKTNELNIPDATYRDVEKISIMSYLRFDSRAMMALNFPRAVLIADTDPVPEGVPVASPSIVTKMFFARFKQWMRAGLVQDEATFQSEFRATINSSDSDELDGIIPPKCIGQFRKFSGRIDVRI